MSKNHEKRDRQLFLPNNYRTTTKLMITKNMKQEQKSRKKL